MEQVKWLDDAEHGAWKALHQMHWRLEGELTRRLAAESCLSLQDYTVLVVLTAEEGGALRIFELCDGLGWEKSRASHHIARMAKRGLVTKKRCGTDGRGWVVVVTELGRAEIEAAAPAHVAAVRELFLNHVTSEELTAIGAASLRILTHLDGLPAQTD